MIPPCGTVLLCNPCNTAERVAIHGTWATGVMLDHGWPFLTAFAHVPGFGATFQVTDLVLPIISIRRKRHENVMSSVMRLAPTCEPDRGQNAPGRKHKAIRQRCQFCCRM